MPRRHARAAIARSSPGQPYWCILNARRTSAKARSVATASGLLVLLVHAIVASPAFPADATKLVIIEGDERILEPPSPLPYQQQRLHFVANPDGGYSVEVRPAASVVARGKKLPLGNGSESFRVTPAHPVQLFGHAFADVFVHP